MPHVLSPYLALLKGTTFGRVKPALASVGLGLLIVSPAQAQHSPQTQVQDVLNNRCVVCHGCYDAPCQLKLSSPDGWARGASKQKVYESSRLDDAPMTRLRIDAKTVPEWRQKGFFPVTGTSEQPSTLVQLLQSGRDNPFKLGAALPDEVEIGLNRDTSCPAPNETADYLKDHQFGGMPYGMAPLPESDYRILLAWAKAGAPGAVEPVDLPPDVSAQVVEIEAFFNQTALKSKLVARYIYEHLFLAHLHLEGDQPDRFFRLIRSRSAPGEPADEIASRRPFDDPGGLFFYRLVPLNETILHKQHIVYEIGQKRLARYTELFLNTDWSLDALPTYSTAAGGNPLSTFAAIPARSRYQFLLDNALYFVRSFIRGPVCYGQVAVNVIEDRFWVSFLDPDADLSVTDPDYLPQATPILELPVAVSDSSISGRMRNFLTLGPIKYQEFRQARYRHAARTTGGLNYQDIWDGDGNNHDARLTVYRNFSSASVVRGFAGSIPETAWVIDFPLFERIYYNLVAGFDVFGNVEHQLTTRLYMDSLRREGERMFLSFLPPTSRDPLHSSWYQGTLVSLVDRWKEAPLDTETPTGITFQTQTPKAEFLKELLQIEPGLWPKVDPINRCTGETCASPETPASQLRPLTVKPAPFAKFMPDIAVLVVKRAENDEIYTLVHDMAHSNVAFVFNEDLRRKPEDDAMTIVPGQFSSYPNFIFQVEEAALPEFVAALSAVRSQTEFQGVVETFGIRRTHAEFWMVFDQVQAALDAQDAVEAGLLDLNRYTDPKVTDPIERLFGFTFSFD